MTRYWKYSAMVLLALRLPRAPAPAAVQGESAPS